MPLPIPLRYVLVYAFESSDGVYIVDAGWDTDDAFASLDGGLREAGFGAADIRGVMVTHIHADHWGLAGRLREHSGAWIALHPADAALLHDRYEEPQGLLVRMERMLRRLDAPASEVQRLRDASLAMIDFVDKVRPDVLLEDGDRPEVPGWDLTALWTPGHSPGHLCFWEAGTRLVLTGDCVLPRITPHVTLNAQSSDDPLGDFLRSLDRLDELDADGALPAHEWRYDDHRARLRELQGHHEARFAEVLDALQAGFDTAWAVAPHMDWASPWGELDTLQSRLAVGEAAAHLRALTRRGVLREIDGEPIRWEVVAS